MGTTGGESKSDAESDVEQYELTEDEEEQEEKTQQPSDSTKRATGKRKRSLSQNDEEEIARRRRKRRSLAFQQRRRSLTPSEKRAGVGGANAAPTHSKQYISDMYSTIIKMSSENKINVKNSWSLHLIDHMEDILDSSKRIAADGDADDDTYNFQKASCTLDASIKIYSYRVDDTWNSSYKILENLSRTEQKHGVDDAGEEGGTATTARKTRKTHARTIEKNLNNINLKAYDTECEADPLFHKMSQSFDEGGAKGMLLANLSVYDGCKILLNSSDVSVVTRKPIQDVADKAKEKLESQEKEKTEEADDANSKDKVSDKGGEEGQEDKETETEEDGSVVNEAGENGEGVTMEEQDKKVGTSDVDVDEKEKGDSSEDVTTEEEQSKGKDEEAADDTNAKDGGSPDESTKEGDNPPATKERISLSVFGNLSCISQDVQSLEVCPPLYRMYDQLDEFYGDEARHKLGIKNDFLLKTPVKGRRKTLDKQDVITMNLAGIMEGASEDESDGEDIPQDTPVDFGDDNTAYDADEDGADTVGDAEEVTEVEPAEDVNVEKEKEMDVIDLAGSDDDEDSVQDDLTLDGVERGPMALDKESSLKSSAADFFRAKVNENLPENYENNLFSQMIESALVRSTNVEDDQDDDQEGKNDYSYFDVKMLRNWAGPGHWKFPAVRKMKQRLQEDAEKDGLDGEVDEDGVAIKAEPIEASTERVRKGSTAGVDKKAITVDFFGGDPDLSRLKAPKSMSSLEISKGNLKKQTENASDLVLPVDTHIELNLFFRHFLKERTRFFKKRGGLDNAHREGATVNDFEFGDSSGDAADDHDREQPFTYNEDSAGFEPDYDEDEGTSGVDDPGTEALYSVEGLVQADRVVEKIGVHYERFAKRVDVKKLKGSIWDHLEKKVSKKENASDNVEATGDTDCAVALNESGKRPREEETDEGDESLETTFENVVENVAGKVPSNVTVSFYFICVLHLANEKGLELKGQDDLRNFQIRKENP
ncbi:hypothetical protein F442_09986 [Phytophthora nicotianae P10297]|uniref:Condensin complex subunit 2 n=3 Tax=Phytophthora nicotianae TaxID=4792 RepID=V9F2N4_PHYNI|nr:hypothetical protein F443_10074 [Phytophthora nicotianae P1569]ETM45139.1 hypothetical protein L914_09744 [Phytophthora nicotianae]ETP43187.1 hypothetical protein F442_09986 [Phytophthora nicotianae P10297]